MTGPFDAITPLPPPAERDKALVRLERRRERQEHTALIRRQGLLDAAWGLLEEVGPQAINMRDLGARAGYTAGALYSYFPSRDHLIDALRQRLLATIADRVARAAKPGKKAGASAPVVAERKEGIADPLPPYPQPGGFERCTLAWWQALLNDAHASALLLSVRRSGAPAGKGDGSDGAVNDLMSELCAATQVCTLALAEEGMAAPEAFDFQRNALCFGIGLLVMQQAHLTTLNERKAITLRFLRALRLWRTGALGGENRAESGAPESDTDVLQVDLFGQ